jgi:hypothetical protein
MPLLPLTLILEEVANVPEDFSRELPPPLATAADFAQEFKASLGRLRLSGLVVFLLMTTQNMRKL